jgi:hypothetical protein
MIAQSGIGFRKNKKLYKENGGRLAAAGRAARHDRLAAWPRRKSFGRAGAD